MQDIIDLYQFWQKGYAEEWKRRMRVKILNQMLPQARLLMKPRIMKLGAMYSQYPEHKIPEAIGKIQVETGRLVRKKMEEIKDYLPVIEKNKEWIIKHFGTAEYNRVLTVALKRHEELKRKEEEAKMTLVLNNRIKELKELQKEEEALKAKRREKALEAQKLLIKEKERTKELEAKMKALMSEVELLKKKIGLKDKEIKEKKSEITEVLEEKKAKEKKIEKILPLLLASGAAFLVLRGE